MASPEEANGADVDRLIVDTSETEEPSSKVRLAIEEEERMSWVDACAADEIDAEDVLRFDHGSRTYAIYRSPDDAYFATDGLCTHQDFHLADGLVMDNIVECPKHNGRFDYTTGAAKGAPVCVDLATYPVKVEGGRVLIDLA